MDSRTGRSDAPQMPFSAFSLRFHGPPAVCFRRRVAVHFHLNF
ncbi:hypothetical protein [Pseudomonas sp. UBA2684]|nr:hypothetical protein [Pseudomonas sp. UBA2684]